MFDDASAISSVNFNIYTVPSTAKYPLVIVNSLLYQPSSPTDSMQIAMIYANSTGTCRGTISAYKCLHTIFNPHTLPECLKPNTLFSGVVSRCFVSLHSLIFSELSIAHIILLKPGWSLKCAAYTEGRGSHTIQGETTSMLCI